MKCREIQRHFFLRKSTVSPVRFNDVQNFYILVWKLWSPPGRKRNRMFLNLRFCHTRVINHYMRKPTQPCQPNCYFRSHNLIYMPSAKSLSRRPLVYSGRTRSHDPVEDIFAFKIASARFAKLPVALSINDELGPT